MRQAGANFWAQAGEHLVAGAGQQLTGGVVALGDEGTASLSFGFEESERTVTESRAITLRNTGPDPVTFAVTVETSSEPDGQTEVSVEPESVTGSGKRAIGGGRTHGGYSYGRRRR